MRLATDFAALEAAISPLLATESSLASLGQPYRLLRACKSLLFADESQVKEIAKGGIVPGDVVVLVSVEDGSGRAGWSSTVDENPRRHPVSSDSKIFRFLNLPVPFRPRSVRSPIAASNYGLDRESVFAVDRRSSSTRRPTRTLARCLGSVSTAVQKEEGQGIRHRLSAHRRPAEPAHRDGFLTSPCLSA